MIFPRFSLLDAGHRAMCFGFHLQALHMTIRQLGHKPLTRRLGAMALQKMVQFGLVVGPTPLKNDGVRQLGLLFPIYGKIKTVPSHQPGTFRLVNLLINISKFMIG